MPADASPWPDLPAVAEFLYEEAALLDDWKLPEWHALFAPDGWYLVPNTFGDPYAPVEQSLYIIADDPHHVSERVKRLMKRSAHAEQPRSVTHRLIGNVRILGRDSAEMRVQSSFITHRTSQGVTDSFFGRHEYRLVLLAGALRIREKRTLLRTGSLRSQGRLSLIV